MSSAYRNILTSFLGLLLLITTNAVGQTVYWTDGVRVQSAKLDGSDMRVLAARLLYDPLGLHVDTVNQVIYWTDYKAARIGRMAFDGSNVQILFSENDGLVLPRGITIHEDYIYWTEEGRGVFRSSISAPEVKQLATGSLPNALAIDPVEDRIYWTDFQRHRIYRARVDGTEAQEVFYQEGSYPWGIALDLTNRRMYWTTRGTRKILVADFDGQNAQDLGISLNGPRAVVVDGQHDVMYWMDGDSPVAVYRARLNGTDVQRMPIPTQRVGWLSLDPTNADVYWTDRDALLIRRGPYDDLTSPKTVNMDPVTPWALAIDARDGLLFWSDLSARRLQSCAVDGSGLKNYREGVWTARGIAVDSDAQKVYWNSGSTNTVTRANLDGSTEETLLAGRSVVGNPASMLLDPHANRMFWADSSGESIRTAALDGTNPRIVFWERDYSSAPNLAFDSSTETLYWARFSPSSGVREMRACHASNCVPWTAFPMSFGVAFTTITIDLRGAQLYWSENGSIIRANLDGSGKEELFPIQSIPASIAIDWRESGDFDGDYDSDLRDFAVLQNCIGEFASGMLPPSCLFWDTDPPEGHVDLVDFRIFFAQLTGPD